VFQVLLGLGLCAFKAGLHNTWPAGRRWLLGAFLETRAGA